MFGLWLSRWAIDVETQNTEFYVSLSLLKGLLPEDLGAQSISV